MSERDEAAKLIEYLEKNHFRATCNSCDETFDLAKAGLFYGEDLTEEAVAIRKQRMADTKKRIDDLKKSATRKLGRVEAAAKSVNIGFAVERLAPAMSGFSFDRNDCRSMFDPIDYVIFDGLSKGPRIEKIVFSDIKSGRARLNDAQSQIKVAVENKKVSFLKYGEGS